jgi:hypothetical protein
MGPVWEGGTSGRGNDIKKECTIALWWKYSVHMYANGKMRPAETIQEWEEGRIKQINGEGKFNYNIL